MAWSTKQPILGAVVFQGLMCMLMKDARPDFTRSSFAAGSSTVDVVMACLTSRILKPNL